ncbi:unnamed protein product [Brassicogethes aeneus]|uniref:BEN domain-containing protein n=1 Tax=Brassicogethes aeneus TaxID=1431903 RepID=A0A9P0B158_BRAAE|nr:unnamed protein product [Brassicogethes aeneus]
MKFLEGNDNYQTVFPSIGKISKNNTHIGQGIWLPTEQFNSLIAAHPSKRYASKFVMSLSSCVYGKEVLKNSSITGRPCNSKQNSLPKDKLDATKLLAIKDFFEWWLKQKCKLNEVQIISYVAKMNSYITNKICELNRNKEPRKSIAKVKEDSEEEKESKLEEESEEENELEEQDSAKEIEDLSDQACESD